MNKSSPIYGRFSQSRDVLLAMVPLWVMAVLMYGPRPLLLCAVAVLSAWLFDAFCAKLRQGPFDFHDISSWVSAAIMTMFMPASAPYWMAVVGSFVAVVIAKNAFGGYGNNIFNPAAVSVAFLSLFWPTVLYRYPQPFTQLPLILGDDLVLTASPLESLKVGGMPFLEKIELIVGNYAGPLCGVSVVVVLSSAVLLLVRKRISWQLPVSFLCAVSAVAYFFPRIHTTRLDSLFIEVFSGSMVFCALFLVGDPVTAPKKNISKLIYGALFGVVTMLFRYYGAYPMGACFAAIAVNAVAAFIDRKVTLAQGRYYQTRV